MYRVRMLQQKKLPQVT